MNYTDFRKQHNKDIHKKESFKLSQQLKSRLKQGLTTEEQLKLIDIRDEFQDKLEDLKVENLKKQLESL